MKYSRKMLDDKMSERTKEIFEYSTCIPPYSLAAGNPCRVICKITEKDHME